jgi:LysM repeat protein
MADENAATNATGKATSFVKRHKTPILIISGVVVVFILYMILRGSNSGSASGQTSSGGATDPNAATGFNPANGVVQGPAGTAGAIGATGKRGPAGRIGSIWQEAKARLIARGNKHPTNAQINRERSRILASSAPNPPPKQRMHPLNPQAPVSPAVTMAARTTHYTVKPGETTASVAAKHGMQASTLHGANGTVVGNKNVMAGQRVRVK